MTQFEFYKPTNITPSLKKITKTIMGMDQWEQAELLQLMGMYVTEDEEALSERLKFVKEFASKEESGKFMVEHIASAWY